MAKCKALTGSAVKGLSLTVGVHMARSYFEADRSV